MNLGIVRAGILINPYRRCVDNLIDVDYEVCASYIQYACYLAVDFCNQEGKLETVTFKNEYYYKRGDCVILDMQDDQPVIKRKLNAEELKGQIDALSILLEQEQSVLAQERAIIKEQFGELEAEIYGCDREEVIRTLKNIVDPSMTKNFKERLLTLQQALLSNESELSREQFKKYLLLVMDLTSNLERINQQLALCGEELIDVQMVYDLYYILTNCTKKAGAPAWFTRPITEAMSCFETVHGSLDENSSRKYGKYYRI